MSMPNDKPNSTELMARLAKGDMAALGDIVSRHQDKVLSLSYRVLGDWHRAEDVAQEVFLRVYRAAKHYKPKAKFTTWLYRIVVNLCFDEQRKRAKAAVSLENVDSQIVVEPDNSAAEKKELAELVRTTVNGLPERKLLDILRKGESKLTPDPKAVGIVRRITPQIDKAMETAARNISPQAEQLWRKANTFWKQGKSTFQNKMIRKLMRTLPDNPEVLAVRLSVPGNPMQLFLYIVPDRLASPY